MESRRLRRLTPPDESSGSRLTFWQGPLTPGWPELYRIKHLGFFSTWPFPCTGPAPDRRTTDGNAVDGCLFEHVRPGSHVPGIWRGNQRREGGRGGWAGEANGGDESGRTRALLCGGTAPSTGSRQGPD